MYENILLEPEQKDLLVYMVETMRSIPRDQRTKFIVQQSHDGHILIYPGYSDKNRKISIGDMDILAKEGLIDITYVSNGTPNVNLMPQGFAYYDELKRSAGQPIANVEASIRSYLNAETFQQKYPQAYNKWAQAEEMLWNSDSKNQLTTIGHLCREALQEFAALLVAHNNMQNTDPDKSHSMNRIRDVLKNYSNNIATTVRPFLDALLTYCGTVIDLVQRQEHGGQKEGQELNWEDARRVVFHVAIVMFEVDKATT